MALQFLRPSFLLSRNHIVLAPRLTTSRSTTPLSHRTFSTTSPQQASVLGNLSDFKAAYSKVIRRGRGPSSGKGKTSGRGHKGQNQHGGTPGGFNGGQTPDEVVHGTRGFKNIHSIEMSPLNLDRIQQWINSGRIDPTKPITFKELCESRCLHGIKDGVKLLGRGASTLTTPIHITVSRASASAIAAVEAVGGTVTTRYYNKQGILAAAYPQYFPHNPRSADPISRKDVEYYRNPKHRGYLSGTLKEGDNPESLFFKSPEAAEKARRNKRRQVGKKQKGDRLF